MYTKVAGRRIFFFCCQNFHLVYRYARRHFVDQPYRTPTPGTTFSTGWVFIKCSKTSSQKYLLTQRENSPFLTFLPATAVCLVHSKGRILACTEKGRGVQNRNRPTSQVDQTGAPTLFQPGVRALTHVSRPTVVSNLLQQQQSSDGVTSAPC